MASTRKSEVLAAIIARKGVTSGQQTWLSASSTFTEASYYPVVEPSIPNEIPEMTETGESTGGAMAPAPLLTGKPVSDSISVNVYPNQFLKILYSFMGYEDLSGPHQILTSSVYAHILEPRLSVDFEPYTAAEAAVATAATIGYLSTDRVNTQLDIVKCLGPADYIMTPFKVNQITLSCSSSEPLMKAEFSGVAAQLTKDEAKVANATLKDLCPLANGIKWHHHTFNYNGSPLPIVEYSLELTREMDTETRETGSPNGGLGISEPLVSGYVSAVLTFKVRKHDTLGFENSMLTGASNISCKLSALGASGMGYDLVINGATITATPEIADQSMIEIVMTVNKACNLDPYSSTRDIGDGVIPLVHPSGFYFVWKNGLNSNAMRA
jgi:hypothetical protein